MKARVVTRISINKPTADVFIYLTDLKYMHLWNPQVSQVSSKKVLRLHSTYQTVSHILGVTIEAANEVVKYVKNVELEISNTTGTVNYTANFKLQDKRGETRLICTTIVWSDNKAFAFSGPVMKMLARRELQTDLQALKIAVENNLAAA